MPPMTNAAADGNDSVTLTLTSEFEGADPKTRTITISMLHSECIGRGSKSEVKNLQASSTNALFNCLVISRNHAKLSTRYNPYDARPHVNITDTDSMHGTYVNEVRLYKNEPFTLSSGDVIRLGDKVSRGDDTHNGVSLTYQRINPEVTAASTHAFNVNKGFAVPEISDYSSEAEDFDYDVDYQSDYGNESISEDSQSQSDEDADEVSANTSPESVTKKSEQNFGYKIGSQPEYFEEDKVESDIESDVSDEPIITSVSPVKTANDTTAPKSNFGSSQEKPIELDDAATNPTLLQSIKMLQKKVEQKKAEISTKSTEISAPDSYPHSNSASFFDAASYGNITSISNVAPDHGRPEAPWKRSMPTGMPWLKDSYGNPRSTIPDTCAEDLVVGIEEAKESQEYARRLGVSPWAAQAGPDFSQPPQVAPVPARYPTVAAALETANKERATSSNQVPETSLFYDCFPEANSFANTTSKKRKADEISANAAPASSPYKTSQQTQMSIDYLLEKSKKPVTAIPVTAFSQKSSKWDKKPDNLAHANPAEEPAEQDPAELESLFDVMRSQQEKAQAQTEEPPLKKVKTGTTGGMIKKAGKEAGKALGLMAMGTVGAFLVLQTDLVNDYLANAAASYIA